MTEMPQGFQPGSDPKAAAAAAKAYAKASRPWFKKKRFIIPGVFVALMVVASLTGGGDDVGQDPAAADEPAAQKAKSDSGGKGETKKEKPAAEPKVTYVKVGAGELLKEFESNELAGDAKYKGKNLEISGKVAAIDTDLWDEDKYILNIGTGDEFEFLYVNCHDMDSSELAKLEVGQSVTVRGEFDDGGDLGVEVADCTLA